MTHFVVIGGFPRAGTTFIASLLNQVPDVRIRPEIYPPTLDNVLDAMKKADWLHAGRWTQRRYRDHRTLTVLNMILGLGKRASTPATSLRSFEGFKTPFIENRAKGLVELLGPDAENPLTFVYCLRDITRNYLSNSAVFDTSVEQYVLRLSRSVLGLRVLTAHPHVRVVPFSLDDYLADPDRVGHLRDRVLVPVGARGISDDALESFVTTPKGTNSTASKSLPTKTSLSVEEAAAIFDNAELMALVDELEQRLGSSVRR
jgi:hypothetical protein